MAIDSRLVAAFAAREEPPAMVGREMSWKRPEKRRVRAIRDRLRQAYGRPLNHPHGDPVHELVKTILSQNTSDTNRDLAYGRLRDRFDSWEEVRDAPVSEVADAIRPGGLWATKAPRIQQALQAVGDQIDLAWLRDAPRDDALDFLTALPGVGRKTAACVLIFSFDRPEIPVDTHVYRVGGRLGLFRHRSSFEEAHDEIVRVVDPEDAYEVHINLIRHGRAICRPRPRCGECTLRRMCPYWRELAPARRHHPDT
jgi:endonuclease III